MTPPDPSPSSPATGLLLLVDLDGVLYRGADPVPGVAALLATRAAAGDDIVYVTNNSMWYREEYVARIAGMGAPVSADRIVSSPRATALYLREHEPSIRHVLTVGASGMERELADAGFRVTRAGDIGEQIGAAASREPTGRTAGRWPADPMPLSSVSIPRSTTCAWPSRPTAFDPAPGSSQRTAIPSTRPSRPFDRAPARWSPRSRPPPG